MSSKLLYDFAGLQTAPGLLARAAASCVVASNFRFPAPGLIRKREGYRFVKELELYRYFALHSIPWLESGVVVAVGGTDASQRASVHSFNTAATQVTSYGLGAGCASESVGAIASIGSAAYLSGPSAGILRLSRPGGSYFLDGAGVPLGREPMTHSMDAAVYSVLSAGTLLAANASRAYRVTWHKRQFDGTDIGGAPTGRVVIRNIAGTSGFAGATSDVTLRIPLSMRRLAAEEISNNWFWRLWGSRISPAAGDSPDDELYLISEAYLTSTDRARGYAVYTDATPDVFLQASPRLHTNTTNFPPGETSLLNGATNGDEPPPSAFALESFADCLWCGAPTFRPSLVTRLIAPLVAGDTLTVTINAQTVVLTAVAGVPVATTDFTAVSGLPSLSLDLEAQARNICDAWNRTRITGNESSPGSLMALFSVSQGSESPGLIRFESTGDAFTVSSSASSKWSPSFLSTANEPVYKGNVLCFSKPGRADSVPPVNQLSVGPAGANIRALTAFRERLLVWTDAGIYAVDGTNALNFSVTLVDSTARILAARSAVVLRDRAYAWCSDGIVEISDGGTRRISDVIEPTLRKIREVDAGDGVTFPGITIGFAIADRRHNEVQFYYALKSMAAVDLRCDKWLAWNAATETWASGSHTTSNQWKSAGCCVFGSDRVALIGPVDDPAAVTKPNVLYQQALGQNSVGTPEEADYYDQDRLGALTAILIVSVVSFQFQLLGLDTRAHWQQLRVDVEGGDSSLFPAPTEVYAAWQTDSSSTSPSALLVPSTKLLRWETPTAYRRATRQRVVITHAKAEPCGIIGVAQTYVDEGSRFAG